MKIDLASGHFISMVPLQGLKAKHKDAYEGAPKIFMTFDENGEPDLSKMPLSLSLSKVQKYGLLSSLLDSWDLTGDDGAILPKPTWDGYEIANMESFGEIGIDDMNEIDDILEPYIAKIQRKPDPKTTTTGSSSGPSKDRASSPKV